MQTSDHSDRELSVTDKLRQIQAEFLILSWIGVSASTIYGFWALGHAEISNAIPLLYDVFPLVGIAVVFCEWYLFRRLARAVLGERLGKLLPGLNGTARVNAQELRTLMPVRKVWLILAGCIAFSALLTAVILWRFAGLLDSIASFSVVMLVGLPVIGMLIVLRR